MTNSEKDRTQLNTAADEVGAQTALRPVSELTEDHVQALREAGIPGPTIAQLLRDGGMEESDVAGFALDAGTAEPPSIVIQTICLGTCKSVTIEITIQVTRLCKPRPQN